MTKKFLKKILFCFIFIVSFFLLSGFQNDVLRVGTTGDYNPMTFYNAETKTYTGFDIALANDLASYMKVKIKFIPTSWPTLMKDLDKFDLAISGITITDERKKQALMSDGYLTNGKTILCRKEDLNKYKTLEDINKPSVRVMENPGGLNEKFARTYLPNSTLIIHNVNEEIPELIAQGKADVMITEVIEAKYYVRKDSRLYTPDFQFTQGKIGILIPKENKKLLKKVNKFLKHERKTGRLNELYKIYIY